MPRASDCILILMESWITLMRWLHIAAAAVLAGGVFYGWQVVWPALAPLSDGDKSRVEARMASRFRPLAIASVVALVVSGLYSILTTPGHSQLYHIVLGVKLLLALHVFAATFLLCIPESDAKKLARRMAGIAVSGLLIIAISAYLRRSF